MESVHRGSAVVIDRSGTVVASWGDVERPVYPRSAVKPIQAVPLVTSGAAQAFDVTVEELALACASHNGEAIHTSAVQHWLNRIGYDPQTLECGAHSPQDGQTRGELAARGLAISPLHNNCSGKHTGFLTICRHMGYPSEGYTRIEHPVQRLVREALEDLTGYSVAEAPRGIDGCGIPVYAVPLRGLAAAMMKFAVPEAVADERTAAALRDIRDAMIARPYLVAGRDRFCTLVMEGLAPNVLVKTGAEGVFCGTIVDQGLGIALKIDDGATRASEVAMGGILRHLNAINDSRFAALRSKLEPDVLNVAGNKVGMIRVSEVLAAESA